MTKTSLLIDADGIVFAAAAAVEKTIPWDDDIYTTHADLNEAKKIVHEQIGNLVDKANGAVPVLAFSCPTRKYFRHSIYPAYKSHRGKAMRPPLVRRDLTEWAMIEYESWTRPGLEADDVLGIIMTSDKIVPGDKILVSPDKDLLQIPGTHLRKDGSLYEVQPGAAWEQLWLQVLMGDSTDGYPGCPGIGAVKAQKILATAIPNDYPKACLDAYHKAGVPETFETMVNVARILTTSSYNFRTKEPIKWQMSTAH